MTGPGFTLAYSPVLSERIRFTMSNLATNSDGGEPDDNTNTLPEHHTADDRERTHQNSESL